MAEIRERRRYYEEHPEEVQRILDEGTKMAREKAIEQLKKIKQIVINSTKITEDDYESHRKDDWFFSVEDALRYGIIDEIIESFEGGIHE